MIGYNSRRKPLTGHRFGMCENLTAVAECPLTGHRKRRQTNDNSWVENPLTGHRHKHTVVRQESGTNEIVPFIPSRDPHMYRNNPTRLVLSLRSVGIVESSSRNTPSNETFSIFTGGRNLMARGAAPMLASTDSVEENFPIAESRAGLSSHRRSIPRRSVSMRSERSSLYAERSIAKALHGGTTSSVSSERSPIRSSGLRSRPSSVCTESSTFGTRPWRISASTDDRMPEVGTLERNRNLSEFESNGLNESVESLELVPLESARLEMERNALELKNTLKERDSERKRKTSVSLSQTKAMIQSFGNRLRRSLRRSKSNLETSSKPELREYKYCKNTIETPPSRPASVHISSNLSPGLSARVKPRFHPGSTSVLSKTPDSNRSLEDFEKATSMKSVHRHSISSSNVSEKSLRRSFLRHSKSSLSASKDAIRSTYVNFVAPVRCLAKDDSRLEDIARLKENTRKSIRHANTNLASENMKEPVIIQSVNSLERQTKTSSMIKNCPDILERAETNCSNGKFVRSARTIKRLEDKPTGRGYELIESYIPSNENPSTFNGLKLTSTNDMPTKSPPFPPSYRPPPTNPETFSVQSGHSSKSSQNGEPSKKRNNSDLSVSSFDDNESQPRVTLPCSLKRRARVSKRSVKKRTNTENVTNGTTGNAAAEVEIERSDTQKGSNKSLSAKERSKEPGLNNSTSSSPTPTASNTPDRKSLGSTLEKRRKFLYGSDKKVLHEPIPVPPPVPGKLKSGFRSLKDDSSNHSLTNINTSNGHISTTAVSQPESTPDAKLAQVKSEVKKRYSGSDVPESGSTFTPVRQPAVKKKSWSRPVSNSSILSNSSFNDTGMNFEMLLKELVNRRASQHTPPNAENSPKS